MIDQENIGTEDLVKNLKATFFDIAGRNQKAMDRIEDFLSKENDPQMVEYLQNLWAQYHDTSKVFLNNIDVISNTLYNLEIYEQDFHAFEEEKRYEMEEAARLQANNSEDVSTDENSNENVVVYNGEQEVANEDSSIQDDINEELSNEKEIEEDVSEDEANEEVTKAENESNVAEEVVEEAPKAENESNAAVEEVVEEAPKAENESNAVVEEVVEEAPKAENESNAVEEVMEEAPKAENESNAAEEVVEENTSDDASIDDEVNTEESPIPEAITELTDNIVSQKNNGDTVTEVAELIPVEPITDSSSELEQNDNDNDNAITEVTELIPEEPVVNKPAELEQINNLKEQVSDILPTLVIPIVEENKEEKQDADSSISNDIEDIPTISEDEKMVFHKGMLVEDKAILVSASQAANLRSSNVKQKELFEQSLSSNKEENVSPAQLEEMMNQLSELYEQGKTEEAELMSEKIRVLNKQMTTAN